MPEESRKVQEYARVKKEWKIVPSKLKMSGKLMAIGCWFPPKFANSGTLRHIPPISNENKSSRESLQRAQLLSYEQMFYKMCSLVRLQICISDL